MALTTEAYKNHTITLKEEENQPAELKIGDLSIKFTHKENGSYHTEYTPYQSFENLIDLAKSIIDYVPNLKLDK